MKANLNINICTNEYDYYDVSQENDNSSYILNDFEGITASQINDDLANKTQRKDFEFYDRPIGLQTQADSMMNNCGSTCAHATTRPYTAVSSLSSEGSSSFRIFEQSLYEYVACLDCICTVGCESFDPQWRLPAHLPAVSL